MASDASSVVSDLFNFLNASPTAFHAVGNFSPSLYVFPFPFVYRENPRH
jgi:aspartyl aminopeptidase